MTVTEAVVTRRTIRKFIDRPIEMEVFIDLLEKSTMAPNHGHREPWFFDLYVGEGRRFFFDSLKKTYEHMERDLYEEQKKSFSNIQAVVVVIMQQDTRQKQWEEDFAAVAALIQNFQLLAWERDIGVVWKTCDFIYEPWFYEKMGVTNGKKIVAFLFAGHAAVVPEPMPRQAIENKIRIINKQPGNKSIKK